MICVYRATELKESIFRADQSVMSSFQQVVQRALKSPVTIEQRSNSSFIWLRRISNFCKRFRILLDFD